MRTDYFSDTPDSDWNVIDFLKFRQKEANWSGNKQKEHHTYITTLRKMIKEKSSPKTSVLEASFEVSKIIL